MNQVDWSFTDAHTNFGVHSIHPYPARFIPHIPEHLIKLYNTYNDCIVFDPFCGSGTTLVESIRLGLDAWGVDINPLACLISSVKTTPISVHLLPIARNIVCRAKEAISNGSIAIPPIPRVDHWFKLDIQKALTALVEQIKNEVDEKISNALKVALSSIINQVSNQESDTRYAAIDKNISTDDVFIRFERAVTNLDRSLLSLSNNLFQKLGKVSVLNKDILKVQASDLPRNIGLVITSPPYPNAYEYWLYHKYRMYWLGMDPLVVKEDEIGARPHYFKKNHQDEHDFEQQMARCFRLLSEVMRPHGIACFLIGRSVIHGRQIDNVALLQRAAKPSGFSVCDIAERSIPLTKKTFNPSHGTINREHIIVFKLDA